MAGRNGAGVFSVTNPDFVSGTTISSSAMDANFADVATALTGSIAADGQTTITGNLPMNSKKLTGLAVGTATGDSVTYGQVWGGVGIKGSDLTSAEPLVIGTDGNYFDVTGTAGIATHTVAAGRHYFTQFDGACILTHHATTQDLPGEADITTAAGDVAEWQSTGANTVQCVNYTKANGTAVVVVASLVSADIGVTVQGYDADTLKADVADVLTAGYAATPYSAGTKSSGTYTPDEANGNFQYAVNGGAHTLAPPTNNCTLIIQYTNNGSAGAITTSGFTIVTGDTLTTTDADDFFAYITKNNAFSHLHITALQ